MAVICGSIARSFGRNSRVGQLSMMAGAMARAVDVGERLGGEDDGRILLAQRLQPLAELAGKPFVVEREPAFVDDEQGRPAVEPAFDAMEEIGEHGRRGAGPDQPLGLEGLDARLAETFGLGIEQPAIGSAEAIGLQGALQGLRLQQAPKDRSACARAIGC